MQSSWSLWVYLKCGPVWDKGSNPDRMIKWLKNLKKIWKKNFKKDTFFKRNVAFCLLSLNSLRILKARWMQSDSARGMLVILQARNSSNIHQQQSSLAKPWPSTRLKTYLLTQDAWPPQWFSYKAWSWVKGPRDTKTWIVWPCSCTARDIRC